VLFLVPSPSFRLVDRCGYRVGDFPGPSAPRAPNGGVEDFLSEPTVVVVVAGLVVLGLVVETDADGVPVDGL
jgi:hypothetical protein